MGNVPERIWATEDTAHFGEDRFHSTTPMRGLTEYLRADIAAARDAELRAKIEQLGREVNISRYGQPDFAWSIHKAAMDDLRAEVDRLTRAVEAAAEAVEQSAIKRGAAEAEADRLRALLNEAREALEFYANPAAWNQKPVETVETVIGTAYRNEAAEMQKDRGEIARATLAKIGDRHD